MGMLHSAYAERDTLFFQKIDEYIYRNQFDSAEIGLRSRLIDSKGDKEEMMYCHLQLAKMYLKLGNQSNWENELQLARNNTTKGISSEAYQSFLGSMSDFYFTIQSYDSADYYAKKFLNELGGEFSYKLGGIYQIIGFVAYRNKRYEEAEKYYEKSLQFYDDTDSRCEMSLVYNKLALIKSDQGLMSQSKMLLDKAIYIADTCGELLYRKMALESKKEILLKEEKFKEAFVVRDEIDKLNDELNYVKTLENVTILKEKFGIKKKEDIIHLLESQNESLIRSKRVLISLLVLSLILIAVIVNFFYADRRNRRFINVQTNRLGEQNKLITDAIKQRDFLYKELNHRIKNNLQLITSMLNLQRQYSHKTNYNELVEEITQKINTIALTYAKMYIDGRNKNDIISLNEYVTEIIQGLVNNLSTKQIQIRQNINTVNCSLDLAIPIGLITNEIITNSLKHAFEDSLTPTIYITLKQTANDIYFSIGDNGVGPGADFSLENKNSLGSKIIFLLSKQMNAHLELSLEQGLVYTFRISTNKTAKQ